MRPTTIRLFSIASSAFLAFGSLPVVLFGATATAQDHGEHEHETSRPSTAKDKYGIVMDELAKSTLERWEKMEYHLGREGVKTMSFTVKVVAKGPLGDTEATGKYSFDGKKGSLQWDNAALGDMLAQRGWSQESFDRLVIGDSHRKALAGAKLTARKDGDTTVVEVVGDTKGGYKDFRYGKDGVAQKFTMKVEDQTGEKIDAVIGVSYEKIGKKYVRSGWSFGMEHPMGSVTGKVKIANKTVRGFHVYGEVQESLQMGEQSLGTQTLTFTDYKINGATADKAATDSKPTTRPAQKQAEAPPGRKRRPLPEPKR